MLQNRQLVGLLAGTAIVVGVAAPTAVGQPTVATMAS